MSSTAPEQKQSLIDDLREIARYLPPSHVPSLSEVLPILGALIAHAEHGSTILDAARDEEDPAGKVARVFGGENADEQATGAPSVADPTPAGPGVIAPATPPAGVPSESGDDALRQQIAQLQTENAALRSQGQTVTTSPADPPAAAGESAPASTGTPASSPAPEGQ